MLTDGFVKRLTEIFSNNVDLKPHNLTKVGDKLFFSGSIDPFGDELCVYTGEVYSPGVTYMVKNINPSGHGNIGGFITAFKDRLIFSAGDALTGVELWVSDGTEAGTKLLRDIYPGPLSSGIVSPVIIGDTLYFSADDGTGGELWRLINPAGQPEKFTDIPDGGAWGPELVRIGKTFIFSASNKVYGTEIWKMSVSGSTATEDLISSTEGISVYPNPVTDHLSVHNTEQFSSRASISFYNSEGVKIMTKTIGSSLIPFSIHSLKWSPGLYFVRIEDGSRQAVKKFIVTE